jgi:hypothetical protein
MALWRPTIAAITCSRVPQTSLAPQETQSGAVACRSTPATSLPGAALRPS